MTQIIKLFIPRILVYTSIANGLDYRGESIDDFEVLKEIERELKRAYLSTGGFVQGPPVPVYIPYGALMNLYGSIIKSSLLDKSNLNTNKIQSRLIWFKDMYIGKGIAEIQIKNSVIEKDIFVFFKKKSEAMALEITKKSIAIISAALDGFPKEWDPRLSIDWSKNRSKSWGLFNPNSNNAETTISIAMATIVGKDGVMPTYTFVDDLGAKWQGIGHLGDVTSKNWVVHLILNVLSCIASSAAQYHFHKISHDDRFKDAAGEGAAMILSLLRKELLSQ